LSFDKSDQETIYGYLKKIDEKIQLFKCDSLELSNVIIFFLTKKFVETNQFKKDWRKRETKVFLIILLEEDIQSLIDFDFNQFNVSYFNHSISLTEQQEAITRNTIFLSRLINLTDSSVEEMDNGESNKFALKVGEINPNSKKSYVLKRMEIINDEIVIVKCFDEKILIIDWRIGSTVATIENINEQEFCWISHLTQIFCCQKFIEPTNEKELKCSLFSKKGDYIRSVYTISKYNYRVNSVAYNKDNCQVYLNIYNGTGSKTLILILNQEFYPINMIDNNLLNPVFISNLNYATEIKLHDILYNIYHYTLNIAFLQEKNYKNGCEKTNNNIYIFDKSSFSVIGLIKAKERLIFVYHEKLLLMSENHYLIQKVPSLKLDLPEYDVFRKFCRLNPFKKLHLISKGYRLPCGNSVCLDCIYQQYNLFKRTLICQICTQEHNLPQKLEPDNNPVTSNLTYESMLIMLIYENKKTLSAQGIQSFFTF
jgi:hypothetical protein